MGEAGGVMGRAVRGSCDAFLEKGPRETGEVSERLMEGLGGGSAYNEA